jgi:hypothetical protein
MNNKSELWALAALIRIAIERNILELQVFGDSKLILDWLLGNSQTHTLVLHPIFEQVIVLENRFNAISFSHIYREHTTV